MGSANLNFIRQQGLKEASAQSCDLAYPALMWQPRAIFVLSVLGLLFESGWYFVALGAILGWNALVPRLNPFDAIYNRLVLKRRGLPPVGPARAPRRFSQGMAGAFMFVIGIALLRGNAAFAWTVQGILFLALALLVFGRFCLGSYLFHLFTGQRHYANRTLPWSGDSGATAKEAP